jgi:thiamine pyrophosphokinase
MIYKSILCLNGELPKKDFFDKFDLPIIAADGAANKLYALGIIPSVVIGDLDSFNIALEVEIIHVEDQNRCDYEKSMEYLEKNALLPTIVVGIGEGELDHLLNNINVFMLPPSGNLLYAAPLYGITLQKSQIQLILPIHTKVSIIGLPHARLITQGLEWDLIDQNLCFPGINSCFNRTKEHKVMLRVLEGQALFLAHDFFFLEPAF